MEPSRNPAKLVVVVAAVLGSETVEVLGTPNSVTRGTRASRSVKHEHSPRELVAECCLRLCPCFAGLDALVPRAAKLDVTSTSAVSEPRTSASAATDFARFSDGAAFGAYKSDGRRH